MYPPPLYNADDTFDSDLNEEWSKDMICQHTD